MKRLIVIIAFFVSASSLSYAFLTDTAFHAEPALPTLTSAGDKVNDPTFGTEIIRLTDSSDSAVDCFTGYSNISSFNRGNSRVAAVCNVSPKRFKVWDWNQSTNTRSNPRIQSNPPSGYREVSARWSNKWNNKTFACANRVLYEVTIPDGTSTTWTNTIVRDFSTEIGGTATDYCEQVSLSQDDDVFAMHYVISGSPAGYLVYKRSTNTVLLNVTSAAVDEVEIDKSGTYLVVSNGGFSASVWNLSGTPTETVVTVEGFNHRAMGNGMMVTACSTAALCKRNLATPNSVTTILASGWSYATQQDHLSMTGVSDDWVLSCRYHTNAGVGSAAYDNECLQIKTDGSGDVRRFVHHRAHSFSNDYDAQPKAAMSMDGRYFTWISNWDGADTSAPNHVYIADMYPSSCNGSSPNLAPPDLAFKNVQKCIESSVDGDTVTLPAGSVSWEGTLTWTNKSITLTGAGIGLTNISGNVMGTYPCLMQITLKPTGNSPAGLTRITGFTFNPPLNCGDNTPNTPDGMINIKGDSPNFRFDHNRVESGDYSGGLTFQEYVRGVIDHNDFVSLAPTVNRKSVVCWHTKWDTATLDFGGSSWAKPSTVGTINQLFFEDNNFDRATSPNGLNAYNDEYAGCRSTHRFNTLTNSHAATHGLETSQYIRAVRHVEYYRNFTPTHPLVQDSAYKYRDGTGIIFDNVVTPNIGTRFGALETLRREDDGSHLSGTWFPWKACGAHGSFVSLTRSGSTATLTMSARQFIPAQGAWIKISGADQSEYNGTFFATGTTPDNTFVYTYTVTGTPATPATGTIVVRSPFDGNTDATGYPCMDQIGRGQGVLFVGTGSNMTPTTAANQVSEPLYCFNNTIAGVVRGCQSVYGADVVLENRDYYNSSRGLRSARPATCTTGEAYWSTDGGGNWNTSTTETYSATPGEDGGLDKCVATNTWQNDWYVPPTYPHSLVTLLDSGGGGGNGGGNGPIEDQMYFFHRPHVKDVTQ